MPATSHYGSQERYYRRDASRYQTVYARAPGAATAPTAGLLFTPELLARLDPVRVTLRVGLDTFRPVTEERLEEHRIHRERYEVEPEAWERIRSTERVLGVATTTVRLLETRPRRPAHQRHRALHRAGLRVPARRRAAHGDAMLVLCRPPLRGFVFSPSYSSVIAAAD